VKSSVVVAGLGILVAVVGAVLWFMSSQQLGLILILGGMVIGVFGLVIGLVQWGVDKSK
jgi:hypothetical protein